MDNAELKAALISGEPVILSNADGHEAEYKRITAIVYRATTDGRIKVSAELLDYSNRCVVHCDPKKIRAKE